MFSSLNKEISQGWHNFKSNETIASSVYGLGGLAAESLRIVPNLEYVMNNWGHDVLLPIQSYYILRVLFHDRLVGKGFSPGFSTIASSLIFGVATSLEVTQKIGIYSGTYDTCDITAYGLGVGISVILDRMTFGKPNPNPYFSNIK